MLTWKRVTFLDESLVSLRWQAFWVLGRADAPLAFSHIYATFLTSTQLDTASPIDSHRWDCIQNHRSTCERNMCLSVDGRPFRGAANLTSLPWRGTSSCMSTHIVGLRLCDDIGSPDVFFGEEGTRKPSPTGGLAKGPSKYGREKKSVCTLVVTYSRRLHNPRMLRFGVFGSCVAEERKRRDISAIPQDSHQETITIFP